MTVSDKDWLKSVHKCLWSIYQASGNGPGSENSEVITAQSPDKGMPALAKFMLLSKHPGPRGWLPLLRQSASLCLKQEAKAKSTAQSHFPLESV